MDLRLARWVACVISLITVAAAWADDVSDELKKLQGKWDVTEVIVEGKPAPADKIKGAQVVFDKDVMRITRAGEPGGLAYVAKLDPSKKPKAIDLIDQDGKVKPSLAIYHLDGDTFKLCMDFADKGRPEDFTAKEGSKHTLMSCRRAK